MLGSKGFCRADEGAEVAGVLEAFEDECGGARAGRGSLRGGDAEGGGNALRGGGIDCAGEDIAAEDEGAAGFDIGERWAIKDGLTAFAEEQGFEDKARAGGLGDEVLSFDAEEVAGFGRIAAERGTQSLDSGVGLARNGTDCGHRCDRIPLKPSVLVESPWTVLEATTWANGIKLLVGKIRFER